MTPRLSRERLPGLHGQTARFYANWIRDGVPAFLDGAGRDAFSGAANYVGWAGAIEEDLAAVFGVLNPNEQAAFREGIGIALAELPLLSPHSGAALNALIRLAALVGAKEAVDAIVPVLVAASNENLAETDDAFRLAFELVVELATPSRHAVHALHMLITSVGFREELAAPALLALARADPANFTAHLDALARPLNAQYHPRVLDEPGSRTSIERDRLLEAIAALVPVAAIAPAFGATRRAARTSDWIVRDWFSRGVSTSRAPRVEELWCGVQEWIAMSDPVPATMELRQSEPDVAPTDEFAAALGELPELVL